VFAPDNEATGRHMAPHSIVVDLAVFAHQEEKTIANAISGTLSHQYSIAY
jgi:hypothetical protein